MMKQTNIKQMGCLILATALLAGCGTPRSEHLECGVAGFNNYPVVEGVDYQANSIYGWNTKNDRLIYSLTIVSPRSQQYYPVVGRKDGVFDEEGTILSPDVTYRRIVAPFHFVYFIDNGEIVFRKSYKELGFEISPPKNPEDARRKLQPILETLIRENMPPP